MLTGGEGVDDVVQIAVHDLGKIVHGQADAVVGDAALREIVGADALIAHTGADLAAALGRDGGFDALLLDLIELGGQHLHALFPVLHLTARLLTGHDDAGRLVDEAHGGAGLVDVLPACAGRTVDLHFDILGPDVDLGLLHFRGLSRHFRRGLFLRGRGMLVFFCHDTNNLLNKNLGHAARLAHISTQRKRCLHTKTPPMSC